MTVFVLKIIAMITMFIDHLASYLFLKNSTLISVDTFYLMRSIGRMSLPIFAYFIVVGYSKTSNLKNYIGRIHLFAILSQIPFILATDVRNYYENTLFKQKAFLYNINALVFIIVIIASYYIFTCNKKWDKSLIFVTLAYLITPMFLSQNGIVLLSAGHLNIFYEFGISLILISLMEQIPFLKSHSIPLLILNLIFIISNYYYIGSLADYEYFSILLILLLRILKNDKYAQILTIIIWGAIMYHASILNVLFVILAAVLIYYYNGERGKSVKYLFYTFYPLHLLLFGLMAIMGRG
ncbi:conjugal transfer protein TraX [Helcococcus kunzii]|uniref:conjugal transfer protein TraX n=1 Tax=Helcococcus kunzii TaxID=40091 RepID=UPI0021A7D942|nr:conjugal transfer protein TraX [Helcococcus kunzii]MCT1795586.1 conjugal transfer protein TraX [Helcococcus kunzii]MCT1989306.1 conjugal transfer protein TraX [Helcococcus kunzii]